MKFGNISDVHCTFEKGRLALEVFELSNKFGFNLAILL